MHKDNPRSMMWETTVRKTQQQQQSAVGRRRGCGALPAMSSVVPSDEADGSSAATTPTTPSSAAAADEAEDGYTPRGGEGGNEESYHAERLLPNGDFYTGWWRGNLPHGGGKYLWTDGCMYEGEWFHGKNMGKGKFSWPSGATYEGEFKAGFMDGFGTYTGSSGDTYRGTWSMNLKHGRGKKSYSNGDLYDGEWRSGLQEGNGRYTWKNGNEYSGSWKAGAIHGRGVLVWANGNCYDGEWEEGLPCGKGQFRWGDGSRYVGVWSKDNNVKKGVYYPSPATAAGDVPVKDLNEAITVDLGDCTICLSESVSILPSQKTLNWSGIAVDFLQKQAQWRSTKSADSATGGGAPRPRRRGSVDANRTNRRSYHKSCHNLSNAGGGFDKICLWEPEGDIASDVMDGSTAINPCREGGNDPPVTARSEEGQEVKVGATNQPMKWLPKEMKKQGDTISKGHKNYELMLNLQLGIRYSVGRPAPATTFDLKASAFDPKEKIWTRFPPEGSKHTPPHQSCEFKWKDYCPVVFRTLRKLFKIDAGDYMISICGNDALRELTSPGKSGSFFYLTNDDRYMIKTVKKSEVKVLLRMLPAYYNHVRAFENTLVTKFFGLHCVKLTGATQKKVRFVIMGNLFCTEYVIHRRYDLKGSSHGRTTDKPEEEIDANTTLKDLDLCFLFRLQKSWFQEFQRQVDRDCEFLEQERIMDYSLLVGLHFREVSTSVDLPMDEGPVEHANTSEATPRLSRADMDQFLCDPTRWATIRLGVNMPARVEQTQRRSDCDTQLIGEPTGEFLDVILFFGIIDILQDYDISKKLEHAYKSIQYDSASISAVDPRQYSRRFRDFILKVFKEDI